jgi:hypothetical protein
MRISRRRVTVNERQRMSRRHLLLVSKRRKAQWYRAVGVLIGTSVLLALLWFHGLRAEQDRLEGLQQKAAAAKEKLRRSDPLRRRTKEIADELEACSRVLERREAILAPNGDAYAWIMNTMHAFSQSRRGVRIESYSQPQVASVGLLPKFPYKWATFHVRGTGYYHEFGCFFADLENTFPHFQIQNVVIAPNTRPDAEPETLTFNFDLVTPVVASDAN